MKDIQERLAQLADYFDWLVERMRFLLFELVGTKELREGFLELLYEFVEQEKKRERLI